SIARNGANEGMKNDVGRVTENRDSDQHASETKRHVLTSFAAQFNEGFRHTYCRAGTFKTGTHDHTKRDDQANATEYTTKASFDRIDQIRRCHTGKQTHDDTGDDHSQCHRDTSLDDHD